LTGEVGSGKSTAARNWLAGLNPSLFKVVYLHWSSGSALDLLRQIARGLDLEPAHYCGDLTAQISEAIVRLHKTRKQNLTRDALLRLLMTCHAFLVDEFDILRHDELLARHFRRTFAPAFLVLRSGRHLFVLKGD
jgi:type II secretory pathway predicted ATPase ExeA